MRRRHYLGWVLLSCLLGACTLVQAPMTPPAPAPVAASTITPEAVTFVTTDGVTLTGTLSGTGATALILSNMGDNDPTAWEGEAPRFAEEGYLVLTYGFRYPSHTNRFTAAMANQTVDDLQAAVAFVRTRGAETIVLVGASLGGMATAKVAARIQPAAVVVISSPADLLEFDFQVTVDELAAITAPKLLIASQDDTIVPSSATQQMFDLATEPKAIQIYPGSAHGVQLFATEQAADLRQRLLAFVQAHAPTTE
jgi:esterase/lipase